MWNRDGPCSISHRRISTRKRNGYVYALWTYSGRIFFSGQWNPSDTAEGGGHVGAAMFLSGSLVTCGLGLLLSLPLSLFTAIFMTEIATPRTQRMIQPAVELFTGIPSVVYGWIGLTVLVPFYGLFSLCLMGFPS